MTLYDGGISKPGPFRVGEKKKKKKKNYVDIALARQINFQSSCAEQTSSEKRVGAG